MLGGRYRALDLTDAKGSFCGKMLAELGVDVVKIEPPEGSAERGLEPFYRDEVHTEKSLHWYAYNANKRGTTLSLRSAEGRDIFRRLVERADFVVESYDPGYLDDLGMGYAQLAGLKPSLILTSITPFGQTGPRANYAACDLTLLAAGGLLNLNGDADRPPLRFVVEQSFAQAGAQAAAATMIAHHYRASTGQGQHVDVSIQEAVAETLFLEQHFWDIARVNQRREGVRANRGNVSLRMIFPCKDGYISWRIFGASMGSKTEALVHWMAEEGMADYLIDFDFGAVDLNDVGQADIERMEDIFAAFFVTKTKAELHEEALKRGIMLFPMSNTRDLLDDRQLAARDFWMPVVHPELNATIRYPGLPFRSTAGYGRRIRRAPLLGEHNAEIYGGELALSHAELASLKEAGVI